MIPARRRRTNLPAPQPRLSLVPPAAGLVPEPAPVVATPAAPRALGPITAAEMRCLMSSGALLAGHFAEEALRQLKAGAKDRAAAAIAALEAGAEPMDAWPLVMRAMEGGA
jgi:hypothetical protein